ncbi:cation transporter [Ectothiorhodospiraceae bacterium WFHF3C12]|nr:cation transporter [Ectothiorhodospiraceae bacterium WFHF3C12]
MTGHTSQRRVLWTALILNGLGFAVEFGVGNRVGSAALLGDSADMLGDALTYLLTLATLTATALTRTCTVIAKAALQLGFAGLLTALLWTRLQQPVPPGAVAIGGTALFALAINAACALLLASRRNTDLNMRSVWLCTRNDLVANVCMIFAALLVAYTGSRWPDLLLGGAVVALFTVTSLRLLAASIRQWPRRLAARDSHSPRRLPQTAG